MPTYEFTAFTEADLLKGAGPGRDAFDFSARETADIDQRPGDEHEIEYDIVAGALNSTPTPVPATADAPVAPVASFEQAGGETLDLFF